jgi:hypothetical protein
VTVSSPHTDCVGLGGAARLLLTRSGFFAWTGAQLSCTFSDEGHFEQWLLTEYGGDPYGRYHAWMQLAVGGENLVKAWGVCTQKGRPTPMPMTPIPPTGSSQHEWVHNFTQGGATTSTLDNYGTLAKWLPHFKDDPFRCAAGKFLKDCRDREAHQYIANTRACRFEGVAALLQPLFDGLIKDLASCNHPMP